MPERKYPTKKQLQEEMRKKVEKDKERKIKKMQKARRKTEDKKPIKNKKILEINRRLHKFKDLEDIFKPFSLVYRDEWDDGKYQIDEPTGEDVVPVSTKVSTMVIPQLEHPIPAVLFTFTHTPVCGKYDECKKFLKSMYRQSLLKGLPDIPYSFAVGGDGTVYELRGWLKRPEINGKFPQLDGKVIDVAYFGQPGTQPPLAMCNAAWELVQYGIKIAFMKSKTQYFTDYYSVE